MAATRWIGAVVAGALAVGQSQAQVIWDNGGFATGPVTRSNGFGGAGVPAPPGTLWSELVDGNGSGGSANYLLGAGPNFRIADNFTLSVGAMLTDIRVYAYSTGAAPAQGFTNGNLQIWNGQPGDAGSTVVFGDTATNRLINSTFTNIYRTMSTTNAHGGTAIAPGTSRPVQEVTLDAAVTLPAGTYWIDYQVTPVAGFTTAFSPFVTFADNLTRGAPGANGRQLQAGPTWADVVDIGDPPSLPDVGQEFPFIVHGTPVPEPGSMALAGLAVAAALARAVWRRRTPA
jgi:PEP-CTERM motif